MIRETEPVKVVQQHMPHNATCLTYSVDASDGRGVYYVHLMEIRDRHAASRPVIICSCPQGFNLAPLAIAGVVREETVCKHTKLVTEYLRTTAVDAA